MASNLRIQTDDNKERVVYSIEYKTPDIHMTSSKLGKDAISRPGKIIRMNKSCLMRFSVTYDKKTKRAICKVSTFLTGVSKRWYSTVAKHMLADVVKSLEYEALLATVRREQANELKKLSSVAMKGKKLQDLDKILHPDKYKSSSPTVRREWTGNGRFNPSSATQARRVVKRGG